MEREGERGARAASAAAAGVELRWQAAPSALWVAPEPPQQAPGITFTDLMKLPEPQQQISPTGQAQAGTSRASRKVAPPPTPPPPVPVRIQSLTSEEVVKLTQAGGCEASTAEGLKMSTAAAVAEALAAEGSFMEERGAQGRRSER